jgi:regulator of CtrA degradation
MTGNGTNRRAEATIDFAAHFATSDQFKAVFKEGMGLVEETANYLDGPGRREARGLDRHGSIAYATESMRLTTRLMQLASWLLLQRALHAGELTQEEAHSEKHRINLTDVGAGHSLQGAEVLPEHLKELIQRSLRLHQRIQKLDQVLNDSQKETGEPDNPVNNQMNRLAAAFGGHRVKGGGQS